MSEDLMRSSAGIKLEWNPENVLKLIELFKAEQCLYNTKNPLYHNKHARSEALEGIVVNMCETLPGVTIMDIKTKLNYLRSQYSRELSREWESKKSGIGTDDVYTPSAYWFEHLHFIKDFVRVRKGKSNISQIVDVNSLSESDEQSSSSKRKQVDNDASFTESEDAAPPKQKRKTNYDETDEVIKAATSLLQKMTEDENTEEKFSGGLLSFISSSISEITNKNLRDEVSSKIIMLLFEYMKKQRELKE